MVQVFKKSTKLNDTAYILAEIFNTAVYQGFVYTKGDTVLWLNMGFVVRQS